MAGTGSSSNNGIVGARTPTPLQLRALSSFLDSIGIQPTRGDFAELWAETFGGRRDTFRVLGYKKRLRYRDYKGRYDRDGIAGRIVDLPAHYTWRSPPKVTDDEVDDVNEPSETPFGVAWRQLEKRLKLYTRLEKLDRLSGIGRFGVMVLGAKTGGKLDTPLTSLRPENFVYTSIFTEGSAAVRLLQDKVNDARFGKPMLYRIDLSRGMTNTSGGGIPVNQPSILALRNQDVDWSRVIHAAEATDEDEIFAPPRLQRVWNLLDDLIKGVGGAAESFWAQADRGLQLDVDKDMRWDPSDQAALQDQADQYIHQFRRIFTTRGVKVNALGSDAVNPRGVFAVISSMVVGTTGIPLRMLFGPERGQFSLPEERAGFLQLIADRQVGYAAPSLLRQLIDRLIDLGTLPEPQGGEYDIYWPDILVPSELEASQIALSYSQAAKNFSQQQSFGGPVTVNREEARRIFPGIDPKAPADPVIKVPAPMKPFGGSPNSQKPGQDQPAPMMNDNGGQ